MIYANNEQLIRDEPHFPNEEQERQDNTLRSTLIISTLRGEKDKIPTNYPTGLDHYT